MQIVPVLLSLAVYTFEDSENIWQHAEVINLILEKELWLASGLILVFKKILKVFLKIFKWFRISSKCTRFKRKIIQSSVKSSYKF